MTDTFRVLCAELANAYEHELNKRGMGCALVQRARAELAKPYSDPAEERRLGYLKGLEDCAHAALAQPEPEGPTDEELQTLAWKIYREAHEKDLRGDIAVRLCRAVLARWGNPQPAPKEPTDEEITDLLSWSAGQDQGPWPTQAHCVVRVALQLWGSPPIEPVPSSPTPETPC
jgi:hypothetical protein